MNAYAKVTHFVSEVKSELAKVSWSTREELTGSTTVVIVLTSLLTFFIFIVDTVLAKVLTVLFKG